MSDSIINCVFRAAFLSVEYGYDASAVIHHPFVSDLIAASAVILTYHYSVVGISKNVVVFLLPVGTPAFFKVRMRTGTHQFDVGIFFSQP